MKNSFAARLALAASLLAPLAASATAMAQAAPPDYVRTESLASVASVLGDEDGHLIAVDDAGGTTILAYGTYSYVVYTEGDGVSSADDLALCTEDAAGGLSTCASVAAPEVEYGYDIYDDGTDRDVWAICGDVLSCAQLTRSGSCTDPLTCDDLGCFCPATELAAATEPTTACVCTTFQGTQYCGKVSCGWAGCGYMGPCGTRIIGWIQRRASGEEIPPIPAN